MVWLHMFQYVAYVVLLCFSPYRDSFSRTNASDFIKFYIKLDLTLISVGDTLLYIALQMALPHYEFQDIFDTCILLSTGRNLVEKSCTVKMPFLKIDADWNLALIPQYGIILYFIWLNTPSRVHNKSMQYILLYY